jgi:hypothetical protein
VEALVHRSSEGSSEKVLISRSSILIHKINWDFYTPHIVQRIEIFKSFEQLRLGVRVGVEVGVEVRVRIWDKWDQV